MNIKTGYDLIFDCPQRTPMLLMLSIHESRSGDMIVPDTMETVPILPITQYRDGFGNTASRLVAPAGQIHIKSRAIVLDHGLPDPRVPTAQQKNVEDLPSETIVFLLPSRYCDAELLSTVAWELFSTSAPGWPRVQAICDFVHSHIAFDYARARATRTASEAFHERVGVCRDYAHLAVTFCRCMNIPARYCTGYLSDVGIPPPHSVMDFAGWFEAFLDGSWYTFDPRNNVPRIGRILMARGRDAADVAITNTFGPNVLQSFSVVTEEIAT